MLLYRVLASSIKQVTLLYLFVHIVEKHATFLTEDVLGRWCLFSVLTEIFVYFPFLKVQHMYWKMRVCSWVTMLVRCCLLSTQTWFTQLLRYKISLCFHSHLFKYFHLHREDVSWKIFSKGCSYMSILHVP